MCGTHILQDCRRRGVVCPPPVSSITTVRQEAIATTVPTVTSSVPAPTSTYPPSYSETVPYFPCGRQNVPQPTAATGRQLIEELSTLKDTGCIPAAAREAISVGQRREHLVFLRKLREMPIELRGLPLDRAVVGFLEFLRTKGRWKETTWAKQVGCAAGALARLTEYSTAAANIRLTDSPLWRDVLRQASKKKIAQERSQAEPATLQDVRQTIDRLLKSADPAARHRAAQLAMMWVTCARPGCILQLKRRDVQLTSLGLHVIFVRGKAHELRKGPHPASTKIPEEWKAIVLSALEAVPPHQFLWAFTSLQARCLAIKALSADLRATRQPLQARSIRRGALMALAAAGVSETDILAFSGHSSVQTLRDYIGVTEATRERTSRMRRGAAHLTGGPAQA